MIEEAKRRVTQLLEINRALTHDLDIGHRNAAQLARERDQLSAEVEELRAENQRLQNPGAQPDCEIDAEALACALEEEQQRGEIMGREMDVLLQDCEAARNRAYQAEESARALAAHLRDLEQERDNARMQLDESTMAMQAIRHRLHDSLDGSLLWTLEGGRGY